MKKTLSLFLGLLLALCFGSTVFAYSFPSTNDLNKNRQVPGRLGQDAPYVNQNNIGVGEVTLEFVNDSNSLAFFEYRIDGEALTSGTSHPVVSGDYIYPGVCVDGRDNPECSPGPVTRTLNADEYVEIRLALGGERDWDFDWTRFDVLPAPFVRSATITSPLPEEEVSGIVSFDATLTDEGKDDSIQWAVRKGTCAAATGTVLGNVDGFSSAYDWDHVTFHASADTSSWVPGGYCFIFNPSESAGDTAIRETREFVVKDTIAPLVTIESPSEGDSVSGTVEIYGTVVEDYLLSHYNISVYPGDADFNDFSKRIAQATVYRTAGFSNELIFEWDSTGWEDGEYLIRLAARDSAGNRSYTGDPYVGGDDSQHVIRVVVNNTPNDKDQCKNDGWMSFFKPVFKNQGDCISWIQSNRKAFGNRKDNL